MAQTAQPADITAAQAVLKEVYTSDRIVSQLNEELILYSQVEKTTEYHDAVGDKAIGFAKIGRNVGTSARSLNGGTLGAAGHQQRTRWELDYAANYLQIKILGTTIAKMATARQAAVRAVDDEVDEGLNDLKKEIQRQLYSNGDALIAQCGTTTAAAQVVLAADRKGADAIDRGWFQVGMYVDIGTTANEAAVVADAKIVSVNSNGTSSTVTIDSSVTTTSSHYISKADNRSGTTSYEMNGLENLVDNAGTFAAINSSTVPEWKANVVTASANLARSHMQSAFRQARQNGGSPNLILTSLNHQEDYYNLLQAQVRFAGDANLASGKVDGPQFNGLPVVADPDCPTGKMYFLDTKALFLATAGDIAWQNTNTGGDILAWVQDEDAFAARAALYANLGTTRRRSHSVVESITVQ